MNPTLNTGILILNKPAGLTSHDVVERVRHAIRLRQVGHAGTLDPMATGVLVVCVGQATRISEYLLGHPKAYRAKIRLGVETSTYDADGTVIATQTVNVDRAAVAQALRQFVGNIQQVPPMYSALRHEGQKLYELARAGTEVERPARRVTVDAIDVIDFQLPDVTVDIRCSAGTYIRSIAHDLGVVLGTGAHLIELQRTASGPFTLDHAITLDAFESAVQAGRWQDCLCTIDEALSDWPVVVLVGPDRTRALNGAPIRSLGLAGTHCRAHDEQGNLLALLTFEPDKQYWRAEKVLT